jgi:RNase P subunit RPR2
MVSEDKIRERICDNCHFCLMDSHPEENMADLGWHKCPVCGFCKLIEYAKRKNFSGTG